MHYLRAYTGGIILVVGTALTVTTTMGCALIGGTGDRIRHAKGYSTEPPTSWASQNPEDADFAYRLPSGALVTLVSSCGRNTRTPLDVLARQLLFGLRDVTILEREKKVFGANEGLFTRAQGSLSGPALNLELFTSVQTSCVFDFSLISPKAIPPVEETEFFDYIKSLRYGKY
jgi:hypothetical protein